MTVSSTGIDIGRLRIHVHRRGAGEPVMFVHGNLSDGDVWLEQLELLATGYLGLAPDLRAFGRSARAPIDATRGVGDFSDDLQALAGALDLGGVHLVGHSLGAAVILRFASDHPELVRSLTLVAPVSPYGFGGTRGDGTPCAPDHAGSGGAAASPDFVRLLAEGDRSDDAPASPRNVIRGLFFPSPEVVRDEEAILDSMSRTEIGDDYYPRDSTASEHWPGFAPGTRGVLNAVSPRHLDLTTFARTAGQGSPPVLWVRGAQDAVIADASLLDVGNLGKVGAVPDWPGEQVYPPHAMDHQTRELLRAYAAGGGEYTETVIDEAGHFLFTQCPQDFAELLHRHLRGAGAQR